MADSSRTLTIANLQGGVNDSDPPLALFDDSCQVAENVEFFYSTLGERRLGCVGIGLPASITADPNITTVTWMGKHLSHGTEQIAQLWVLAQQLSNIIPSLNVLVRNTFSGWQTIIPVDAIYSFDDSGHRMVGQTLHNKFFLAYNSPTFRLHVWDGATLRRAGVAPPVFGPTAANNGGGAFAGTRYYQVRYVEMSGTSVVRRSEPSPVTTFIPSGAGSGALITKPPTVIEGETHWELEASTDNANFYMISRQTVATTTYTDTAVFATGYAFGILSEPRTAYTVIPSGRYLSVDGDRLLIAGDWATELYDSRVWWTPAFGSTGVGNDERLDMTVNPYLDLDGFEGGRITGMSRSVNGKTYVFKIAHTYQLTRTGQRLNAYDAVALTKVRGALPGSVVDAVEENGNPAVYFLDSKIGPMRIGANGIEWCGEDLNGLWSRVNQSALVPAHGVFYQKKNQVHYWVALDGSDYPNAKIILHTDLMKSGPDGARRGWVTVPVGDRIAAAHCSFIFSNNIDAVGTFRSNVVVPFIGKDQWNVTYDPGSGVVTNTIKNLIQQCDTGTTDAFTAGDTDAYYYARIKTRPFTPVTLLAECGIQAGVIVAEANQSAINPVFVRAVKNFTSPTDPISLTFTQEAADQTAVIKKIDNLTMSGATTVELELGDLDETIYPQSSWRLHAISLKIRPEQTS